MMKRTYVLDAQDDGQGGFEPLILNKSNLGFDPADTLSSVQVSASDLDGGDYTVSFLPHKGAAHIVFEGNVPTTSAVLMSDGYCYQEIKVDIANAGGNAAPRVVITFISRSF